MTRNSAATATAITMAAWALSAPDPRSRPVRPPSPGAVRGPPRLRARPSRRACTCPARLVRSSREDRRRRACLPRRSSASSPPPRFALVRVHRKAIRTAPPRSSRSSPTWSCSAKETLPAWIGRAPSRRALTRSIRRSSVGRARTRPTSSSRGARPGRALDLRDPRHDRRRDARAARRARAAPDRAARPRARRARGQPGERVPPRRVRAGAHLAHQHASSPALYLVVLLPAVRRRPPAQARRSSSSRSSRGCIPVLGNLISNTFIVIVEPDVFRSRWRSLSLAFLVVIHKLEYFLNAKIIGSQHPGPRVGAPGGDPR